MNMKWTPELIARARRMGEEGRTAVQVAAEIGCTRRAITDAGHRFRISFRGKPPAPASPPVEKRPAWSYPDAATRALVQQIRGEMDQARKAEAAA